MGLFPDHLAAVVPSWLTIDAVAPIDLLYMTHRDASALAEEASAMVPIIDRLAERHGQRLRHLDGLAGGAGDEGEGTGHGLAAELLAILKRATGYESAPFELLVALLVEADVPVPDDARSAGLRAHFGIPGWTMA